MAWGMPDWVGPRKKKVQPGATADGVPRHSGATSGDFTIDDYVPETPVVPYRPNNDPATAIISSNEADALFDGALERSADTKRQILTDLLSSAVPTIGESDPGPKGQTMIAQVKDNREEELLKAAKELRESRQPDLTGLSPEEAKVAPMAIRAHKEYPDVPASLLMSLTRQESGFDPLAVSSAGAQGLTQFMPFNWDTYDVELGDSPKAMQSQMSAAGNLLTQNGFEDDPYGALSAYTGGYSDEMYNDPVYLGAKGYVALDKPSGKPSPQAVAQLKEAKAKGRRIGMSPDEIADAIGQRGSQAPVTPRHEDGVLAKITPDSEKLWGGKKRGKVTFADWMTEEQITGVTNEAMRLGRAISGVSGVPVNVISGYRPGSTTTSGNVSDHSSGNALDIEAYDAVEGGTPEQIKAGDRIATTAARVAGADVTSPEFQSFIENGGVYETVSPSGYRVQILWKTDEGGNHHNHVHVGIRDEEGDTEPGYLSSSTGGYSSVAPSSGSTSFVSSDTGPVASTTNSEELTTAAQERLGELPAGNQSDIIESVLSLLSSPVPSVEDPSKLLEEEDELFKLALMGRQ